MPSFLALLLLVFAVILSAPKVLGPNGYPDGADIALRRLQQQGTTPAKCYLDLCNREGSWASNEGEITEEAALVFVTGYLNLARVSSSTK